MQRIDPAKIERWEGNPRKHFDPEKHKRLVESVTLRGVLQPLMVRKTEGRAGKYVIVAGERRWRAAQAAGLSDVPCVVRELDDREALEIALCENLEREDIDPFEEGEGYIELVRMGWTAKELSERFGRQQDYYYRRIELRRAGDDARSALREGTISLRTAEALGKITQDRQVKALKKIVDPNFQKSPLAQTEALKLLRFEFIEPAIAAEKWARRRRSLEKQYPGAEILSYEDSQSTLGWKSPYEPAENKPNKWDLTPEAEADWESVPTWGELAERYGGKLFVAAPQDSGDAPELLVESAPLIEADIVRAEVGDHLFPKPLSEKAAHEEHLREDRRKEKEVGLNVRRAAQMKKLVEELREMDLSPLFALFLDEMREMDDYFQELYGVAHGKDGLNIWEDDERADGEAWVQTVLERDGTSGMLWLILADRLVGVPDPSPWIRAAGLKAGDFPDLTAKGGNDV